jgi:hypothetical protein
MSTRLKLVIVGILLFLALGTTAIAAGSTYRAVQNFQQQRALVTVGDVRSIRSWMTIPHIAHLCHVPESYLYSSLGIPDTPAYHHATLHALSLRFKRPVNDLISQAQRAIVRYRHQHHRQPAPTPPLPFTTTANRPSFRGRR